MHEYRLVHCLLQQSSQNCFAYLLRNWLHIYAIPFILIKPHLTLVYSYWGFKYFYVICNFVLYNGVGGGRHFIFAPVVCISVRRFVRPSAVTNCVCCITFELLEGFWNNSPQIAYTNQLCFKVTLRGQISRDYIRCQSQILSAPWTFWNAVGVFGGINQILSSFQRSVYI